MAGGGDRWHLDEVVVTINGKKHWLWRAVNQYDAALDVVQSRRDGHAARRLMRKLPRKHGRAPRVLVANKLKSYAAANKDLGLNGEHRRRKGLNNRAEKSHQPTRGREKRDAPLHVGASTAKMHFGPRPGCKPFHALSLQLERATEAGRA